MYIGYSVLHTSFNNYYDDDDDNQYYIDYKWNNQRDNETSITLAYSVYQ